MTGTRAWRSIVEVLKMRIIVIIFLLTLAFSVCLKPRLLRDSEPLVVTRSEDASAPVDEATATRSAPDAGPGDSGLEKESTKSTARATPLPEFRSSSVITEALIGYLVEAGLAKSDGERLVRAAMNGLTACRNTFPESDADRVACDRNVIHEAGMYDAFRRLSREVLDWYASEPAQER
jgi:hypothetical protein